jgi:hypothetical protein
LITSTEPTMEDGTLLTLDWFMTVAAWPTARRARHRELAERLRAEGWDQPGTAESIALRMIQEAGNPPANGETNVP